MILVPARSRGSDATSRADAATQYPGGMETSFMDVRATDTLWPQLNESALLYAYAAVERDRDPWCLFTCWQPAFPPMDNWGHHAWVCDSLRPRADVQTLVAHYCDAPGARTRFEPWIFAGCDVTRAFVESTLRRHRQDLAFWSDGVSVHALTTATSRCLGEFRPGAVASVICESSTERASFLGFDLPTASWVEALARTAYVGAAT